MRCNRRELKDNSRFHSGIESRAWGTVGEEDLGTHDMAVALCRGSIVWNKLSEIGWRHRCNLVLNGGFQQIKLGNWFWITSSIR